SRREGYRLRWRGESAIFQGADGINATRNAHGKAPTAIGEESTGGGFASQLDSGVTEGGPPFVADLAADKLVRAAHSKSHICRIGWHRNLWWRRCLVGIATSGQRIGAGIEGARESAIVIARLTDFARQGDGRAARRLARLVNHFAADVVIRRGDGREGKVDVV